LAPAAPLGSVNVASGSRLISQILIPFSGFAAQESGAGAKALDSL